ncbi:unnamed protein product [Caenorhabditis brenneri]
MRSQAIICTQVVRKAAAILDKLGIPFILREHSCEQDDVRQQKRQQVDEVRARTTLQNDEKRQDHHDEEPFTG